MRRVLCNCAVLLISGLVVASCGSTTPSAPSPATTSTPSPATTAAQPATTPALLGHWAGGGPVSYVDAATGRQWGVPCSRAVDVSAQQGADFTGSISSNGSGANSDPHCGYGSSFNAHLSGDGAFTMSASAPPSGGGICPPQRADVCCRRLSGGDTVTGTLLDASHLKGSVTARASCMDPSGKPFDGEMTIEFTVTRITTTP